MKLIREDDKSYTLKHPDGHEVKIAKGPLTPDLHKKIKAYAEGGSVEDDESTPEELAAPVQEEEEEENIPQRAPASSPLMAAENVLKGAIQKTADEEQGPGGGFLAPDKTPPPAGPKNLSLGVSDNKNIQKVNYSPAGEIEQIQTSVAAPYQQALKNISAGITGEALAQGKAGQEESKVAGQEAEQIQNLITQHQETLKNLNAKVQQTQQEVLDGTIDPNRVWNNKSTGQKISTVLGMILGGFGAAAYGGKNPAMELLNQEIDRDIDSQKVSLGQKKTALEGYLRQYGNVRDASQALRLDYQAMAAAKLQQIAAKTNDPVAKARALQQIGQLENQMAPQMADLAWKQTVLGHLQTGGGTGAQMQEIAPVAIRAFVPEKFQEKANKDMDELLATKKLGEMAINSFDKVNNMFGSGKFTNLRSAELEPVVAALSKDTAGRFTPADAKAIESLFPNTTDLPNTRVEKRQKLIQLINQKFHSTTLSQYGIPLPVMNTSQPLNAGPSYTQVGMKP